MRRIFTLLLLAAATLSWGQQLFPMQGFSVLPPLPQNVDKFCKFIEEDLGPDGINALFLRIDYTYQFKSIPAMAAKNALSEGDVKKILASCRRAGIELIPLVNMLGHQSWAGTINRLLEVYPQLDETPYVPLPKADEKQRPGGLYKGDLYCKSYCTLHPDLNPIIFALLGEIIDVFEARQIHMGLDEVYYIGEFGCPRCAGKDKAKLFADEVNKLNAFAKSHDARMWMWGDRLLDGSKRATANGNWEADTLGIHPAIDLIDRDVRIADWHYERPDLTPVIFATKGFNVAICPWRKPDVAVGHVDNMVMFRKNSPKPVVDRYLGYIHTDWNSADSFIDEYHKVKAGNPTRVETSANSLWHIVQHTKELAKL